MVRRLAVLLVVLATASLAGCAGLAPAEDDERRFCPVDEPGSPEGVPDPDQRPDPGRGITQLMPREAPDGSGSTTVGRWVVAGADEVGFQVTSMGGLEGAAVTLWTPDGRELTITDGLPDGTSQGEPVSDVRYRASIGSGYGDRLLVGVEEPADGVWTLQLENPSREGGMGGAISQLHVEGPPTVESLWEGSATVGEPFRFEIAVEDENRSVRGAEVYGRVHDAGENRTVNLTFRDDGEAPDREAGDGIYTAERTFSEPGEPRFWVEACKDGWVRSAEPGFVVVGEHWDENASATADVVDLDDNGAVEWIKLTLTSGENAPYSAQNVTHRVESHSGGEDKFACETASDPACKGTSAQFRRSDGDEWAVGEHLWVPCHGNEDHLVRVFAHGTTIMAEMVSCDEGP